MLLTWRLIIWNVLQSIWSFASFWHSFSTAGRLRVPYYDFLATHRSRAEKQLIGPQPTKITPGIAVEGMRFANPMLGLLIGTQNDSQKEISTCS